MPDLLVLGAQLLTLVYTENVVRIDLATESQNHPGRWSRCYSCFSTC